MVILMPATALMWGVVEAKSAFFGALIVFLASLIVKVQVFRKYRAQQPEQILARFYGGLITKTVFMILAMLLILTKLQPVNFLVFFAVIFLTHFVPSLLTASGNRK